MPKPDYTLLDFPPAPGDRPYVVANMVMSLDGKTVIDGSEAGLGSDVDRRLMRELRVHADLVLVGGATLRTTGASPLVGDPALEGLRRARGRPRAAVAAVLSASGRLPFERSFFTSKDFRALVYLSERCPPSRRRAVVAAGRPVVTVPHGGEPGAIVAHAATELGARLLLLEGGAGLNALFFAAGLVDELFLTLGPLVVGGTGPGGVGGPEPLAGALRPMDLVACVPNSHTSEVYLRYRRRR